MEGGCIAINEWLIQNDYLVPPSRRIKAAESQARLEAVKIDWPRTIAWGAGGYYGRVFLNVKGREPQGFIAPEDYEATRDRLIAELEALGDPQGEPIGTRVLKPEQLYRTVRGAAPPDLFVYFGNLSWRSVGTVGTGAVHTFENDTGPDDANHAADGLVILNGPGIVPGGPVPGLQLMDITPTVLNGSSALADPGFDLARPRAIDGVGTKEAALADASRSGTFIVLPDPQHLHGHGCRRKGVA